MSEDGPKPHRHDRMVRSAHVGGWHAGPMLELGALRSLVAAADGLPDDAEVTVERTQAHSLRKDEYFIGRINVQTEDKGEARG